MTPPRTRVIVSTANRLLDDVYRPGQIDLFDNTGTSLPAENQPLMPVSESTGATRKPLPLRRHAWVSPGNPKPKGSHHAT
jgi:hypothetical protein